MRMTTATTTTNIPSVGRPSSPSSFSPLRFESADTPPRADQNTTPGRELTREERKLARRRQGGIGVLAGYVGQRITFTLPSAFLTKRDQKNSNNQTNTVDNEHHDQHPSASPPLPPEPTPSNLDIGSKSKRAGRLSDELLAKRWSAPDPSSSSPTRSKRVSLSSREDPSDPSSSIKGKQKCPTQSTSTVDETMDTNELTIEPLPIIIINNKNKSQPKKRKAPISDETNHKDELDPNPTENQTRPQHSKPIEQITSDPSPSSSFVRKKKNETNEKSKEQQMKSKKPKTKQVKQTDENLEMKNGASNLKKITGNKKNNKPKVLNDLTNNKDHEKEKKGKKMEGIRMLDTKMNSNEEIKKIASKVFKTNSIEEEEQQKEEAEEEEQIYIIIERLIKQDQIKIDYFDQYQRGLIKTNEQKEEEEEEEEQRIRRIRGEKVKTIIEKIKNQVNASDIIWISIRKLILDRLEEIKAAGELEEEEEEEEEAEGKKKMKEKEKERLIEIYDLVFNWMLDYSFELIKYGVLKIQLQELK